MQYFNKPKKVILIRGNELIIRRPAAEDAKALLDYLKTVSAESDNLLFGEGDISLTEEQERSFIEKSNSDASGMLLVGTMDGEFVSICNIRSLPQKRISHNSEVGISVKKSHWRQGIGEAMLVELIEFAKNHENITIVRLGVKAENSGAIKLYEKLGFRQTGTHEGFFKIDGKYYDEIMMDLHLY